MHKSSQITCTIAAVCGGVSEKSHMRRFALQHIRDSLSHNLANKSLKENFISNMGDII